LHSIILLSNAIVPESHPVGLALFAIKFIYFLCNSFTLLIIKIHASALVNDTIPYEAVRKILGHSDPNVIKHYAKLNVEMLRQCTIEVPEPSGKFKEFLQGGETYDEI